MKMQKNTEILNKLNTHRQKIPLKDHKYPEENFLDFRVQQYNQEISLHTYRYPNVIKKQSPKSVIVFIHGLNQHINNSAHIAHYFSSKGHDVVGYDFRGFGKSEGIKGYLEKVEDNVEDTFKFIQLIRQYYNSIPDIPIFIIGESLGGLTSFLLGIKYSQYVSGIILLAPAIKPTQHMTKFKWLSTLIAKIFPKTNFYPRVGNKSSKDPAAYQYLMQDPFFNKNKYKPGTICAIVDSAHKAASLYNQFNVPFLIIQGGSDYVCNPSQCSELMEQSPSQDKEQIYIEDMWHGISLDPEIEHLVVSMENWISKRCK